VLTSRKAAPEPVAVDDRTVRATRKRFLRRQRARRWVLWRRLLVALLAVALVAGSVWLVFFSSVLAVHGAKVTGTAVLTEAEVEQVAAVPLGVPLATADLAAIEARVEGLAPVRSAEVSRSWPDQVEIAVTEREAVAAVSWQGEWRGLDQDGVLFRSYPEQPKELPEVTMKAATPVEALAEAAAVVDSLPAELLARVRFVDVESIDAIRLSLRGGAVVNWGSAELSEDKAAVLAVLLEQKARVYDVTAPGRPTTRR
jgi:cell division protein FtsQ